MQFTVRNLEEADVEELVRLEEACFPSESKMTRENFLRELTLPIARLKGAAESGAKKSLRGYLNYWVIDNEVHILKIAVDPEFRRQGLARILFEEMLEATSKAEAYHLELRESNEGARAFYEKTGFVICGKRPKYYAHKNEDALLMVYKKMSK